MSQVASGGEWNGVELSHVASAPQPRCQRQIASFSNEIGVVLRKLRRARDGAAAYCRKSGRCIRRTETDGSNWVKSLVISGAEKPAGDGTAFVMSAEHDASSHTNGEFTARSRL